MPGVLLIVVGILVLLLLVDRVNVPGAIVVLLAVILMLWLLGALHASP